MADRIEEFPVTVAAGGTTTTNFTFTLPNGEVTGLDINFPKGCAGLVQTLVLYAGAQVIPKALGTFLKGDDQTYHFELNDFPTGQGWQAATLSNDASYPHTLRFVFHIDELTLATDIQLPPIILLPQTGD